MSPLLSGNAVTSYGAPFYWNGGSWINDDSDVGLAATMYINASLVIGAPVTSSGVNLVTLSNATVAAALTLNSVWTHATSSLELVTGGSVSGSGGINVTGGVVRKIGAGSTSLVSMPVSIVSGASLEIVSGTLQFSVSYALMPLPSLT